MSTGVGITTSVGALRLRRARAKRCGTDAGAVAGDVVDAAGSAMEVGVRDMWPLLRVSKACQLAWLPAVSLAGCCGRVLLLWTVFAVVPWGAGWRVDGNGQFAGTADRMGMVMSVLAQVLFGDLYGWGVWSVRQQPRLQPSRVFGLGPLGSV